MVWPAIYAVTLMRVPHVGVLTLSQCLVFLRKQAIENWAGVLFDELYIDVSS